eukprot:CCRYP_005994-RA/>CCRYP_005994-RA protein AED:0.49 eAED:1.00 QI:0/0/0/1/0/0/2/0/68
MKPSRRQLLDVLKSVIHIRHVTLKASRSNIPRLNGYVVNLNKKGSLEGGGEVGVRKAYLQLRQRFLEK